MHRAATDRLIIYRLGSLGDTVAALPCFHLIEQAYPDCERIVLTNIPESSKAAPLDAVLRAGGFIHGTIPYPLGLRSPTQLARLRAALRGQRTQTLIYLAASRGLISAWRDVAFFKLAGFTNVVGAPLSTDLQENRIDEDGIVERESHRLARTLASLGKIDLEDRAWWDLRLTPGEYQASLHALGLAASRQFIGVNTGGKVKEKDWGVQPWTSLLRALGHSLKGWSLVFFGGKEDHERATRLATAWSGGVINLCGRLAPRESAAALSRASLFIGHDSGPLHLADAVGTPAVGIFGGYNRPEMWHPSGATTQIIHRIEGLSKIGPAEVLEKALSLSAPSEAAR